MLILDGPCHLNQVCGARHSHLWNVRLQNSKGLCKEMDAIMRKFWWNPRKDSNRFFTPMTWSRICKPFSFGRLGFCTFESFKKANIAKLAWWILSGRDSFCVKVLRAKYEVDSKWLQARPAVSASFSWRGLEGVRSHLSKGVCLLVGNGNNILISLERSLGPRFAILLPIIMWLIRSFPEPFNRWSNVPK